MNKQTEALNMAYKAEETGNLQDLVDAVNMLVEVVEALEQPAQEGISKMETTTPTIKESLMVEPAQEPMDIMKSIQFDRASKTHSDVGDLIFEATHPAPAWQGLSEEEFIYFTSFVNAETLSEIEKTFREKNYGKV